MLENAFMAKVLHLTPHLGGGVGSVVLNWVRYDKGFAHSIATLDSANEMAQSLCQSENIPLFSKCSVEKILELVKNSDIVLLHFWNHPLLYDFLVRNTLPPCRLLAYMHISGLDIPNVIPPKVLAYADRCIYTTSISTQLQENTVIVSTGGVEHVKNLPAHEGEHFTAGYIGTVDYAKMHPQYVATVGAVDKTKFLIVGGQDEVLIAQEADARFTFTGKVTDIRPYLAQMDVFAYLLNPQHFGTAEQVLQEAMAAGVVPIVLNNKCEMSLVEHGVTGLVAQNLDEYKKYLALLRDSTKLRQALSQRAKKYAQATFSLETFVRQWQEVFCECLQFSPKSKHWEISTQKTLDSHDIFLESLGSFASTFLRLSEEELRKLLQQPHWKSKSKGTPLQYYNFLPKCTELTNLMLLSL